MNDREGRDGERKKARFPLRGSHVFLLVVCAAYAGLGLFAPHDARAALDSSGNVLFRLLLPLSAAFAALFLVNLLVKPAHISRLLGKGSGLGGVLLSTVAGIMSMGPIYTWYPLLEELRNRGASEFHLANFLSNRAVKPYLLPLMVFYFGWTYSLVLNVLIVCSSLCAGWVVEIASGKRSPRTGEEGKP